jgi:hypothetical protein
MPDGKTIQVKIYQLRRIMTPQPDEWSSCVVAAGSEKEAREIANQESKAEGYVWTDGGLVESVEVGIANDGVYGLLIATREQ